MRKEISDPLALATLTWVPARNGGRMSGPPTAPVYAATAAFRHGDDKSVYPGWPAAAPQVSILLQRISQQPHETEDHKVDFLFPELVASDVRPGAQFVVLEGPKVVATGTIKEVYRRASAR